MDDDFVAGHPAPIPTVEERTPAERLARIVKDLDQLAREFDGTPLATRCADAAAVLRQGPP